MQSSSDHRPCARAGSTPKKLRCGKSTLTSAQKHSFKSFVRGPICINVEGQDSQFWTEWWQSLQKQSELPRKDYEAKNLNLSLSDIEERITRPVLGTTWFDYKHFWSQARTKAEKSPHRRSNNAWSGLYITYDGDPGCRWMSIFFWQIYYSRVWFFLDPQGSRKLPPAWEEREEYDSLAPLPVIPRWSNSSNLFVKLCRKGWQLVLKVISTTYCLLIL